MRKILRYAFLFAMTMCGTAAMAADVFGGVGKGWGDEGCNRVYTLAPNKTITLDFVVNTRANEPWFGWITMAKSGDAEYFFMQPTGYAVTEAGWGNDAKTTAAPAGSWYKCNFVIHDDATWATKLTGAHVVLTISRVGKEIRYLADIRPTVSDDVWGQYFVMDNCGDGTQDVALTFGADQAELALNSAEITDSEEPAVMGKLVGEIDNSTLFAGRSEDYTLAPESSLTINFINYSCKAANWYNWIFEAQKEDKYLDLRCDNFGWGAYWDGANCKVENYDWNTFKYDMDGALVKLVATRTGSTLTVEATQTTKAGKVMTETYTVTNDDFASGDIAVRMLTEGNHIDIVPELPTAIKTAKAVAADGIRYNLAGQKVGAGYKGVVIENGKKIVVK